MARPPLWLTVEGTGPELKVSLARCKNCGKTKIGSSPCGFDHLAAVMEFSSSHAEIAERIGAYLDHRTATP